MERAEAIKAIKDALQKRSGKPWSVTGGRGTAWGWLRIDAPPSRRTWRFIDTGERNSNGLPVYTEAEDQSYQFGHTGPEDRATLAKLLGIEQVHPQGESVPSGSDYWQEYVDRAAGLKPTVCGKQYWD